MGGKNLTDAFHNSGAAAFMAKHNISGQAVDKVGELDSSVAMAQEGVNAVKMWFDPMMPAAITAMAITLIAMYAACAWCVYSIRRAIKRRQMGEVEDLFAEFDKDNSGQLDKKEAHLFLEKFLLDHNGWDGSRRNTTSRRALSSSACLSGTCSSRRPFCLSWSPWCPTPS